MKLAVTLTVKDGHLTLDLSDCSPQLGSGKNVPLTHCYATAYFCLKSIVDPFVPTNEGLYRTVTIIAPARLVVNPVAPAAVSSRNMTSMILAEAINNALGQAAPTRSVAAGGPGQGCISAGADPQTGRYFINYENLAGRSGRALQRRRHGRRDDQHDEYVEPADRGDGDGIPAAHRALRARVRFGRTGQISRRPGHPARHALAGRQRECVAAQFAPEISGAGDGGRLTGRARGFHSQSGYPSETRLPLTTSGTPFANGDVLRVMTPGGAATAIRRERDPEAVRRDLREGKISAQVARDVYGLES